MVLLIVIVGGGGYYVYLYDKSGQSLEFKKERTKLSSYDFNFWRNLTPKKLEVDLKKNIEVDLKNIKDINRLFEENRNMVHLIVINKGNPETLDKILSYGVDINASDSFGNTPLLYAVLVNSYILTETLLKHENIKIDSMESGATPLLAAVSTRKPPKMIKLLLEKGANPNIQSNELQVSSLIAASMPNRRTGENFISPKVIQYLLDYDADINIKDKDGKTALDYMKENPDFTKTPLFKSLSQ